MCPNQGDNEWRSLSAEDFAKACDFERELQAVDEFAWLHRSCRPLGEVEFDAQLSLTAAEDYCSSGMCFV
jgi:hypothetical protein